MTKCYYGDAFVINGKGLVVFGKGKTRVISNKVILKEDKNNYRICNDSICHSTKLRFFIFGNCKIEVIRLTFSIDKYITLL